MVSPHKVGGLTEEEDANEGSDPGLQSFDFFALPVVEIIDDPVTLAADGSESEAIFLSQDAGGGFVATKELPIT